MVELLRQIANRSPFYPFTIYMNNGARFTIREPDGLVLSNASSMNALVPLEGDRFSILYLKNIAHISTRGPWPKVPKRRGRSNPGWQDGD